MQTLIEANVINTKLCEAAQRGDKNTILRLMTHPLINPNFVSLNGCTPLLISMLNGHFEIAEILLTIEGINPTIKNTDNETALDIAQSKKHTKLIEILTPRFTDHTALKIINPLNLWYIAIEHGDTNMILSLIEANFFSLHRQTHNGETAIYIAAQYNHFKIIKLLLTTGIDPNRPNNNGETPLYMAAKNGYFQSVIVLLSDPRVNINLASSHRETPLYIAVKNEHLNIVKLLINNKKTDPNCPDIDSLAPLYCAAYLNHPKIMQALLTDRRVNRNPIRAITGNTPLHIATYECNREIIQMLINDPLVDIFKKNALEKTALEMAVQQRWDEGISTYLADERILNFCLHKAIHEPDLSRQLLKTNRALCSALCEQRQKLWVILSDPKRSALSLNAHAELLREIITSGITEQPHPLYIIFTKFDKNEIISEIQNLLDEIDSDSQLRKKMRFR